MTQFQERGAFSEIPMKQKIMTPDVFDVRMKNNPAFADQIAGSSMFPLSRVVQSMRRNQIVNVPTYEGQVIHSVLEDTVFEALFGKPAVDQDNPDWLIEHRNGYGPGLATYELGEEMGLLKKLGENDFRTDLPNLVRVTQKIGVSQEAINHYFSKNAPDGYMRADFMKAFGSEEQLLEFLRKMYDRKGVQVVYGDRRTFTEFMRKAAATPIDDRGVFLSTSIPNRHVLAILPIGTWEQREIQKRA